MNRQAKHRIDPDPVSVGIVILSVLANVTTVLVYLDQLRRQRLVERRRGVRLRTKTSLRGLRNDLRHLRASAENVFSITPPNSREGPFRFGQASAFLDRHDFDMYSNEYKEVLERILLIQRRLHRIMVDLSYSPDGSIDLPMGQLREANSTANRLLEERLTVADAYRDILKLIDQTTAQLSDIDEFLSEFPNA
jgi:hypothetical protein